MSQQGPRRIDHFQVVMKHFTIDKNSLYDVPHSEQNVLYVLDGSDGVGTLWRRALPLGRWEKVVSGGE